MSRISTTLIVALLALHSVACGRQSQTEPANTAANAAASPAPAPGTSSPITEQRFRAGMMLEEFKTVVYKDETGSEIPFEQFMAGLRGGRSFSKDFETDHSVATLTIDPGKPVRPVAAAAKSKTAALHVAVASEVPLLTRKDIRGNAHDLASGERYTLLSFYFAECVPCIKEIPHLNALHERGGRVQVVSVTFDDAAKAKGFVEQRGLKVPVVAGAQDYITALGVRVFPTLVLVSPDGRLVAARSGYEPADDAQAGLKELTDWMATFGVTL